MPAQVQRTVTDQYDSLDLDITDFTHAPRSNCISFNLRLNRADGTREERSFQIPQAEYESVVAANVEAFQKVRAACFNWLQSKDLIPAGTDTWPGA